MLATPPATTPDTLVAPADVGAPRRRDFRGLADSVPAGIVETDAKGQCVFVNERWCELMGRTPAEAAGTGWSVAIHPDDRDDVRRAWATAASAGAEFDLEYRTQRPDGTIRWLHGSARAVTDTGDRVTAFVGTVMDVTASVVAREQLADERRFVNAIVEAAGTLVIVLTPEGRIVRFNRECERLSGYTSEELQHEPIWDLLLLAEEREAVHAAVASVTVDHSPVANENHWLTRSGESRLIEWSNTALCSPDGRMTHVVATGLDVTEARRAAREAATRARLSAALRTFGRSISTMRDSPSIWDQLVDAVATVVPYDQAAITVATPEGHVVRSVRGVSLTTDPVVRPGEGPTGMAIAERRLMSMRIPKGAVPAAFRRVMRTGHVDVVCVPLIHDAEVLGALTLAREPQSAGPAFDPLELEVLDLLSSEAALALVNARLLQEVSELAIRDPLTGLFNRRYFDATLDHLLAAHRRDPIGRPMTAIMFDLDHFGRLNNRHGHLAGDTVIKAFADILRARLRASDLTARYGGEEFVVVTDTGLDATVKLANDIRAEFRRSVHAGPSDVPIRARVSAGCAQAGPEATREDLLGRADLALYAAKRKGRDRVSAAAA